MNKSFVKTLIMLVLISMFATACTPTATPAPATEPTAAVAPTTAPTQAEKPAAATAAPAQAEKPTAAVSAIDCKGAKAGDTISLLYQWSGAEETRLQEILKPLVDTCGIVLKPESTRDQALLDTKVQAGNPPDIAFWTLAAANHYQDKLFEMDKLGASKDSYPAFFVGNGTVNGKWLALPVKADIKTIIWYSPAVFAAKGYKVPATWEDLNSLVDKMAADGNVPWSMGFESGDATGWTGSDFIQDILLQTQGPEYVNKLISGEAAYNSPEVKAAYSLYSKWATDPKYTVGGSKGTLSTAFLDAIYKPFMDPPQAMMVKQSGFAGGEIAKKFPDLKYGTDYDFFQVPGVKGLQGGADLMLSFSDSAAVKALVTYLASPVGAVNWAKAGFDETPNKAAVGAYTDPALAKKYAMLMNTSGFTYDIGDTIPGGFGKAEWTAIIGVINGKDIQTELDAAAKVQAEATKKK
jgi:alpha-glucoside transport system substrate-binding protein